MLLTDPLCNAAHGLWLCSPGLDGLQQLSAPVENSVYFLPEVLIMNTQKNPYTFSFLPGFHQATQKACLPPEVAVEWKWEAAKEVSCSSQRNPFSMKYLNNWHISLNVIEHLSHLNDILRNKEERKILSAFLITEGKESCPVFVPFMPLHCWILRGSHLPTCHQRARQSKVTDGPLGWMPQEVLWRTLFIRKENGLPLSENIGGVNRGNSELKFRRAWDLAWF